MKSKRTLGGVVGATATGEFTARPGRSESLRQANVREVVHLLRTHGPCSRADLARASGLSAPTVSSVIASLRRKGLIEEMGPGVSNGGRRPDLMRFNAQYGYVAGVDIGGSQVRVALADLTGTVIGKWSKAAREDRTPAGIVARIHEGIRELARLHHLPSKRILALATGAPGITDVRAGLVLSAPHLTRWQNVPLRELLEARTNIPTAIENDVNLGALGESWCGSARGVRNFVFLAIGTGVGAGIFVNGHLYHGSDWSAGEVGYLQVPGTEDFPLILNRPGPLESVIGGLGIERAWKELVKNNGHGGGNSHRLKPTQIFDNARDGDLASRKILEATAHILARAVANLSVTLNPSLIVFGGGIGTNLTLFQTTRRILEQNELAAARLALSLLGADAQLYGAIRLALDHAQAKLIG